MLFYLREWCTVFIKHNLFIYSDLIVKIQFLLTEFLFWIRKIPDTKPKALFILQKEWVETENLPLKTIILF